MAPAAAFHMYEMATFLNRHFYGIFTPPLTLFNVLWNVNQNPIIYIQT